MNCCPFEAAQGFGRWQASLALAYARRDGTTIPVLRRHSGPLRVQKHFYPEGPDVCHHIVVHPPGGIAGGDALAIDVDVGTDAHALVTSPGAAKWYRSESDAGLSLTLRVAAGGMLEWLPLETILFAVARCVIGNQIDLAGTARLLFADVTCFGRPGSGERFASGYWRQRGAVRRDGRLLWCEESALSGDDPLLSSAVGLRGHSVLATLLWCGDPLPEAVHLACRERPAPGPAGVTQLPGVWNARCLCDSAEDAHGWLRDLWSVLRPAMLGRAASQPRIWAT